MITIIIIMGFFRSRTSSSILMWYALACLLLLPECVNSKRTYKCSVCQEIVNDFAKGIEKTAKSNYGGGNTHWEEKSLGSYARSEVRLVEIMEELWKSSNKEVHNLLEEYEDLIEAFWFKVLVKTPDARFFNWFCLDNVKACCPNNTWGPDCESCSGLKGDKACSGNGNCDGEGTREGTGECRCHSGYQGDVCTECTDGWYEESKNEAHKVCKACHISCKSTCWDGTPKGCDECNKGWLASEDHGCQDRDECHNGEAQCKEDQYCSNTAGSFSCFTCDVACQGCTGAGSSNCKECNEGFSGDGKKCHDIDECAEGNKCTGANEKCVNEPGTFLCDCEDGFVKQDGICIPKPKEPEVKEAPRKPAQVEDDDDDNDDDDDDNNENEEDLQKEIDEILNIKSEL